MKTPYRIMLCVTSIALSCGAVGCSAFRGGPAAERHRRIKELTWGPKHAEKALNRWRPGPKSQTRPLTSIWRPRMNIIGDWVAGETKDFSRLTISREPSGLYAIVLRTGGARVGCAFGRAGAMQNGALMLSRPLCEYGRVPFHKLYPVIVDEVHYLVRGSQVHELNAAVNADGQLKQDPKTLEVSREAAGAIWRTCYARKMEDLDPDMLLFH